MRTLDYSHGHPPRTQIDPYTNNNPLLWTLGKWKVPKVTYFGKEAVLLTITKCDPQLYDNYLEQ